MVKVISTSAVTLVLLILQTGLMNCHYVTYRKMSSAIYDPFPQHEHGFGYLITAGESVNLPPNGIGNIKTGLQFVIPPGIYGYVTTWEPTIFTTFTVRTAVIGTSHQTGLVVSLLNNSNSTNHIEPWNIICRLTFHEVGNVELRPAEKTSCPCTVKQTAEKTEQLIYPAQHSSNNSNPSESIIAATGESPKQPVESTRLPVTGEELATLTEKEWPSWF